MLTNARRGVVFTGAGISTESGIPDFRSPGGVWSKTTPIDYQAFISSEDARRESWRHRIEINRDIVCAQPNRGHRAVAGLVRLGKVSAVITQNIDGLHQKSGIPESKVIELHGNTTYARCLNCGTRYELAPLVERFQQDETLPVCRRCGGIIKTATISFGQAMPEEAMQRAHLATLKCDLFVVVGSSLAVYPAAGFPVIAKENGVRLVILNRAPTDFDSLADLVLHAEIGPTLGRAVGVD
jgi:NAD-dependent deacetylase